jgi:hypothetical protein
MTYSFVALTSLALQLDSKTAKTSFGKLPLSDEKSNPVFGFTQAKRDENQKLYLGDVTKNNNIAKQSPGPVYRFEDEVKYQKVRYKSKELKFKIKQLN